MSTDVRVRYTRKVIKEAFIELLKEKPLHAITVKEICARADINRTTFYKHFRDTYDVFDQLKEDAVQGLNDLINRYHGQDSQQILLIILRTIRDHREEFAGLLQRRENQELLYQMSMAAFRDIRERSGAKDGSNASYLSSPLHYGYYAGGIGGVLGYWVGSGMKESPEEIAEEIRELSAPLWRKN